MRDYRDAKLMARALKAELAKINLDITHSQALELVARQLGFDQWNTLAARIASDEAPHAAIALEPPIPIFRIFDVDKAMEFYRDYLGFAVDFEHRFGGELPALLPSVARRLRRASVGARRRRLARRQGLCLDARHQGFSRGTDGEGLPLSEARPGGCALGTADDGHRPVQQPHRLLRTAVRPKARHRS